MGEVHPCIPLLCVCGNHDVGNRPTAASIEKFKQDFGDDYFGFWIDKMKGVVLNSNLYFDPSEVRLFLIELSPFCLFSPTTTSSSSSFSSSSSSSSSFTTTTRRTK